MKIKNNQDYTEINEIHESAGYMPGLFCNNLQNINNNKKIFNRNLPFNSQKNIYMEHPEIKQCSPLFRDSNISKRTINTKNREFNQIEKSDIALNIDNDSKMRRLNSKKNNCHNEIANNYSKQLMEIDDVGICNRPYPKIAIQNSYSSHNLPNGIKDCRNINSCSNSKPFPMCINENEYNSKMCEVKDWSEYSRINDTSENMVQNTRFYTDKNTHPFILNHIAVEKPKKCIDQYCLPLFNMNTSANAIDGKCVFDKEVKKIC